jgi:chromate transporter
MTLLTLFAVLLLVNFFTIGGGYVMLPLLHTFFVEQFRWLTEQEFVDAVAVGQVTPGPLTIMNAFIGFKVAGLAGAVAATAGSYLPSLLVVTFVTKFYLRFKDSRVASAILRGIKPAVVGMLLAVAVNLAGVSASTPLAACICLITFAAAAFTNVDPSLVVVGAGIVGAAIF